MSDDRFLSDDIVGRQKSAVVGGLLLFVCHRLNTPLLRENFSNHWIMRVNIKWPAKCMHITFTAVAELQTLAQKACITKSGNVTAAQRENGTTWISD